MTGKRILQRQAERTQRHLELVLSGIELDFADYRLHDRSLSVKEQVIHLCECYQALLTTINAQTHEWGGYVPPTIEWPAIKDHMFVLREQAYRAILEDPEDRLQGFLSNIVGHDSYHIGQLVALRLMFESDWNETNW